MMFDPKVSMSQARGEVTKRGGPWVGETVALEDGIFTIAQYQKDIAQYAECDQWAGGTLTPAVSQFIQNLCRPAGYEPISLSSEQALQNMDVLLGDEMARALRYLMKAVPAVKIHNAEIDDENVAYALKYVRGDGEQFFLATVVKYLEEGKGAGGWLPMPREYFSHSDTSAFAKELYTHAFSVRGLASEYFGRSPKPFPDPI